MLRLLMLVAVFFAGFYSGASVERRTCHAVASIPWLRCD